MDKRERAVRAGAELLDARLQGIVNLTDGHLWRQIGMTGSEHDECVLCGAVDAGLGVEADEKSKHPCVAGIQVRLFGDGSQPPHLRVKRFR